MRAIAPNPKKAAAVVNDQLQGIRILTVGWMMLIFFLSSRTSLPAVSLFSGTDLVAHAAFYGVLGVFLARSLAQPQGMTWKRVFILTLLVIAYGVTDEYHQSHVPGPTPACGMCWRTAWAVFWRH